MNSDFCVFNFFWQVDGALNLGTKYSGAREVVYWKFWDRMKQNVVGCNSVKGEN